jgi:hypothetical protein
VPDERWAEVEIVPGLRLTVSDQGAVRCPPHFYLSHQGGGYGEVRLNVGRATFWRVLIHRLVYRAFVGPIPPGHDVHHRSGCRTDNRLQNLALVPSLAHRCANLIPGAGLRYCDRSKGGRFVSKNVS